MSITLNSAYLRPLIVCYFVSAIASILAIACYPKNCDPKTDPLKCQCPSGACGPYPEPMPVPPVRTSSDAGTDASK